MGTGLPDPTKVTCTDCHGDSASGNPAPPHDLEGQTDPTLTTIGAHTQHLKDSAIRKAVGCAECHVVPEKFDDPNHNIGRPARLTWGPLATHGGETSPNWSSDTHTCSATYCHGQTLTGGSLTTPDWIVLDGSQAACGTCHGNPPPPPHPQKSTCKDCHSISLIDHKTIDVEGGHHIDGKLDLVGMTCTSCHGTPNRDPDLTLSAAPPLGTKGETANTTMAVGAHQEHLKDSAIRKAVACSDCHRVPTDATHANGQSPKMVWGALATTGNLSPSVDEVSHTCSNTWCHGAGVKGGTLKTPDWTKVGQHQADCGTCHGNPPPAPHPQNTQCGLCHKGTVKPDGTIDVAGGKHIDGVIERPDLSCTSCHGTKDRVSVAGADLNQAAAPPIDSTNNTDVTALGVGAHLAHVNPGPQGVANPIACTECHPDNSGNLGHTNGVVDIDFSRAAVATANASNASLAVSNGVATCSSTWCHGGNPKLTGGTTPTPSWNTGFTADCTSCHGFPPPPPHVQNADCNHCHTGYSRTGPTTGTVNLATHLNGTIDHVVLGCSTCHGTPGRTGSDPAIEAAPPTDTTGASATNAVGAHLGHLTQGPLANPLACTECHAVPSQMLHATGTADVAFGTLAKTSNANPQWSSTGLSCSTSWCHGNFRNGNPANTPVWNGGTAQAACGTCHGDSGTGDPTPRSGANGTHPVLPAGKSCGDCHAGYTRTSVNLANHVNGKIDIDNLSCTSCHGDSVRNDPAPPVDTHGNTSTTAIAVGAHQAHVQSATLRGPIGCAECHQGFVPSAPNYLHSNGQIDLAFGPLANQSTSTAFAVATATCASNYCHGGGGTTTNGSTLRGGGQTTPVWTTVDGSQKQCNSCHGNPPPAPHVQNSNCNQCHAGYSRTGPTTGTVNVATHINGTLDVVTLSCTTCHGTAGRPVPVGGDPAMAAAPPSDTTGSTTSAAVGAHQAHLTGGGGGMSKPIQCLECHALPTDPRHANGTVDIAFGTLAKTEGSLPGFSGGSCSSTYCHGNFKFGAVTGNANNNPSWNGGAPSGACGTCHGDPATGDPTPTGHIPIGTQSCGNCHPGYTRTTVDPNLHVNGVGDGGEATAPGTSCGMCHPATVNAMTTATPPAGSTRHYLGGGDVPTYGAGPWAPTASLKASGQYGNASCTSMCHGDHPHTTTTDTKHKSNVFLDANSRSATADATTRDSTDFEPSGSFGLCVSCHSSPVDTGHPAISGSAFVAAAHNYTTFNAFGPWTYTLHDASTFSRNCTKCHADPNDGRPNDSTTPFGAVHSSSNASLLAGTSRPNNALATFICSNCHGNGTVGTNLSGKDLVSQLAKTFGHPADADNVHDSLAEFNNAAFGNGLGLTGGASAANRHANCLDCHDPHEALPSVPMGSYTTGTVSLSATVVSCPAAIFGAAQNKCYTVTGAGTAFTAAMAGWWIKVGAQTTWYPVVQVTSGTSLLIHAGAAPTALANATFQLRQLYRGYNLAGAALQGAWGAELTSMPAAWTPPASGNFTKKTMVAGTDLEATLCFKCHTGFYGALPSSPSGGFQETDVAMEFNTNNVSFHPVLASAGNNLGATSAVLPPWTRTSTMACSDCHESESPADLNGPHGSTAKYVLKGPNTLWDNTLTLSTAGMPAGTFCANCHSPSFTGSRFTRHTRVDHAGLPCMNCHIAIPHGSTRPGMLIAPAGVAAGVPAQTSVDTTSPYYQGNNAIERLYIKSYPATNTTDWQQSNCGCNGTGH